MMKKKIVLAIILGFFIYSCGPSLYMPSSSDIVKQQRLLSGRKLYVNHCSSCHNLHLPKEFDTIGWETEIDKMQERAKITDEEKQSIIEYLTSQPKP